MWLDAMRGLYAPVAFRLMLQACELTPREREIVEMLIRGLPIADMASSLWLSPYTVRDHVKAVFAKLGVRSRPELNAKLFHEHYAAGPRAPLR